MATQKTSSTPKSSTKSVTAAATALSAEPRDAHTVELARISGILLAALLAVMTFLLSAGLQHPHLWFNIFFYAALGTLALNLVLFAVGNLLLAGAIRNTFRVVQQAAFIVSIVAVTGFVIVASLLFFAAPSASSSGAGAAQSSGA